MKKHLSVILLFFIFLMMLSFPSHVLEGAKNGLMLWFQTLIPSLLPFMIVSNLFIYSNAFCILTRACGTFISNFFQVSQQGTFAIIMGFICGYPMGAKIIADLRKEKFISREEGGYLLSFCNNSSPGFIISYIVLQIIQVESMILGTLIISIVTPLLLSFIFRKFYKCTTFTQKQNRAFSVSFQLNFQMFDRSIMDAFENITKIGGYVILFSILISVLKQNAFTKFLPILELTNGIKLIAQTGKSLSITYPAIMGLLSFGGVCSVVQTQSMLADTDITIFPYIIQKLITALVTSLFATLYMQFIHR